MSKLRLALYAVVGIFVVYSIFSGDDEDATSYVEEEVVYPTEGLITTVDEVETDLFKIADEVTVTDTTDSRIIANYMDNTSDTFTLQEARLIEANNPNSRQGSVMRTAAYGFMGFMMYRSLAHRPNPNAYRSQQAYNKSATGAGKSVKSTATRQTVRRPTGGKSGFGSGKSSRSYGG